MEGMFFFLVIIWPAFCALFFKSITDCSWRFVCLGFGISAAVNAALMACFA